MPAVVASLPCISVVVPSYNQGGFLSESLDSIFRQNYPHLEVVVMDGGSTDASVAVIQRFASRLKHWQSSRDGGQSAAINAGMSHCRGDLVCWLNSDDYYWRDALWVVGRAWAAHPGRGLYLGNGFRYDQATERYTPFNRRHMALNRDALRRGLDYLLQPSCFFLRTAWQDVGGLRPDLHFCMDWDLLLRLAERYPAVLINEFLSASREYQDTKTSGGGFERAAEIDRTVREHNGGELTPGGLFYTLEALVDSARAADLTGPRDAIYRGLVELQKVFAEQFGNPDGFPEIGDPQDCTFLPLPGTSVPPSRSQVGELPSISVVTPSFNQAAYLGQTLDSILGEKYPRLETIVMDGGSTDGSVDILRRYDDRLTSWQSEPDRGPAHAINKGLAQANGEVLAWLSSDDLFAPGAVWEAARMFAADPDLDMVYGNALYIDEQNKLLLADHGSHRTGLYFGQVQPLHQIPRYWQYVHAVPQPTVFFRRRLLERCGPLDEYYKFIFDFELFHRFVGAGKVRKLERTQAYYRIHAQSKTTDWNKFLVELYRFSRPLWPGAFSPHRKGVLRNYVAAYLNRRYPGHRHTLRWRAVAGLVALSASTGIGNPEAFGPLLRRKTLPVSQRPIAKASKSVAAPAVSVPAEAASNASDQPKIIARRQRQYRSFFCSYLMPYQPGYSGGEIRDFHLLRHLLEFSEVEFFEICGNPSFGRADPLGPSLNALHTRETLQATRPELIDRLWLRRPFFRQKLERLGIKIPPLLGDGYHQDALVQKPNAQTYFQAAMQEALELKQPDFLFVSPQSNPIAFFMASAGLDTRLVMASYDVEAVRMRRLAAAQTGRLGRLVGRLEATRASRFERDNLACYDGIIAVSDLDRELFVQEYGFPPERVHTLDNGVDTDYFAFGERLADPRTPVMFMGSLGYAPNEQAARRLMDRIMPRVWQQRPEASVWIVGQYPPKDLLARSDGERIRVTGMVEDVRLYLTGAAVQCVPLMAGSGTKYKVLESLSAGLPVVGTALAAEGLEAIADEHFLLGESDEELAAAILRVLDSRDLSVRLAAQGRALVEHRYSWQRNLAGLEDWLSSLAKLPRRNASSGRAGEAPPSYWRTKRAA